MTTLTTAGQQVHADTHEGRRVVVGVDDSPAGLAALRWAVRLARSRGAQLVAVRVWRLGMRRHGGHRSPGSGRGHVVLAFPGAQERKLAANLTKRAFRAAGGVPDDLDVIVETPEAHTALGIRAARSPSSRPAARALWRIGSGTPDGAGHLGALGQPMATHQR
jgi:nucleotide-binding universal stress UspA family protein